MPTHPGRPCRHPGCTYLVRGRDVRYCSEHAPLHRQPDKRESAADRGYGARWRSIRDAFLAKHRTCEVTTGCTNRAIIAHHKIRRRDGGTDDEDNLQASCGPCHSRLAMHGWDRASKSLYQKAK